LGHERGWATARNFSKRSSARGGPTRSGCRVRTRTCLSPATPAPDRTRNFPLTRPSLCEGAVIAQRLKDFLVARHGEHRGYGLSNGRTEVGSARYQPDEFAAPASARGVRLLTAMDRDWPGVFVSSTCIDLIDLRAELEGHLRDLGFLPMLSDRPMSNFEIAGDKDAVATCLENVKRASSFVCVLSQRYGVRLADRGNVSTTHLEYRAACDAGVPVRVYVRDRLIAEYNVWKGNPGGPFTWIQPDEHGVFELMAEHDARAKDDGSNWLSPYQSSVDLKVMLARDLGARARKYRLRQLLEQGGAPTVVPHLISTGGGDDFVILEIEWENVGPSPAFEACAFDPKEDEQPGELVSLGHFAPGAKFRSKQRVRVSPTKQPKIFVRYCTPTGDMIEDRHQILAAKGRIRASSSFSVGCSTDGAFISARRNRA